MAKPIPRPRKEELAASWVHPRQPEQSLDDKVTKVRYVIPAMPGFVQGGVLLGAKPRRVVESHHPRGGLALESTWFELEENER